MSLQVNEVCQQVRKNALPMGGIQVITLGDFYQLAPVPNKWIKDPGLYCFQSTIWKQLIPHKLILQEVQRQHDPLFIKTVSETARGCPSSETSEFVMTLNSQETRSTHLFSRRIDAHIHNHFVLNQPQGPVRIYKSVEGKNVSPKMRRAVDAPKHLALKVNAPVILTVNITHNLVNGLQGTVVDFRTDSVLVYFPLLKAHHDIGKHHFFLNTSSSRVPVFVCAQIPLGLSYGLTIHKSQGMTMDSLLVDCSGAFQPGQVSVGIGRVREKFQLTVVNYRPGLCPPHPPVVNEYYGVESVPLQEDKSCCKERIVTKLDTYVPLQDEDDRNDSTSEDEEEEENVEVPTTQHPHILPNTFDALHFTTSLHYQHPITDMQHEINRILDEQEEDRRLAWCNFLYIGIHNLAQKEKTAAFKSKHTNKIVQEYLHKFTSTEEFQQQLQMAFCGGKITEAIQSIAIAAVLYMKDFFFNHLANSSTKTTAPTTQCSLTGGELAKIRYVGGMCVGQVLHRNTDYVCRNIHKDMAKVNERKDLINQLTNHTYNTLTIAQSESNQPSSLTEIAHRQTPYGHLTIVDDELFNIFKDFHIILQPKLDAKMFQSSHSFRTILDDCITTLLGLENISPTLMSLSILYPILTKYMRTCVKEMGLRVVHEHVQWKLAHRKQVIVEEAEGKGQKRPLHEESTSSSQPPQNHPTLSPSSSVAHNDNICSICKKEWVEKSRLLWVECTVCSSWLHRKCDPYLKPMKVWREVQKPRASYPCPTCRTPKWWKYTIVNFLQSHGVCCIIK